MTAPRLPERVYRRRRLIVGIAALTLVVVAITIVSIVVGRNPSADGASAATTRPTATASDAPTASATPTVPPQSASTPAFDNAARSLDDPSSIWVVVNKSRALNPATFVPPDLVYPDVAYVNHQPMRQEVATALAGMFAAGGQEAGLQFAVQSAYRSYETQVHVYDSDVAQHGQAYADVDTAQPGHSEHQTGLAVDISASQANCSLNACFGATPEGQWLAANAWRFGFVLRYPNGQEQVTGVTYEPWHFRYVGVDLATRMQQTGVTTLEAFFSKELSGR